MVYALIATIILEALLYEPHVWRHGRKILAYVLVGVLPAITLLAIFDMSFIWGAGIAVLSLTRMFNAIRIIVGRIDEDHLWRSAFRASAYFILAQSLVLVASFVYTTPSVSIFNTTLALVQIVVAFTLLFSTLRTLQKSRTTAVTEHYTDAELPTVTVAIPARNETSDLEECLRSILASNYPKLEIIVLDDCSHDRTPDIIKGFAHDGVRFIKGAEPGEDWLAKNQAYERLRLEATGELVLFCGVDVRMSSSTIRSLVTAMKNRNKQMVSILPRRLTAEPLGGLIQPMRYWWELALPRRYFDRPPVLSTCWIIDRKVLDDLGGFGSVKHAIIPESIFARDLVRKDMYSFIRADDTIDVQTRKSSVEQRETTIRMRYPQAHRRPEMALLIIGGELVLLFGPFVGLIANLLAHNWSIAILELVAIMTLMATHLGITLATNPPSTPMALCNLPLAIIFEVLLGMESMIRYEFSKVTWKERNITFPVMHVIPRLPRLDDRTKP